jgi:hypothetical protein
MGGGTERGVRERHGVGMRNTETGRYRQREKVETKRGRKGEMHREGSDGGGGETGGHPERGTRNEIDPHRGGGRQLSLPLGHVVYYGKGRK